MGIVIWLKEKKSLDSISVSMKSFEYMSARFFFIRWRLQADHQVVDSIS